MAPLVTIVIPTYNSARYIAETVDSCLAQTYPNCEIIVVDDGSTDNTHSLLERCYGDRIRYFYQTNRGPAAARNRGIREARGTFIQFCDADDQLYPTKVERCVDVFRQRPDVGVVYTRYQHVAEDGQTPLPINTPPLLDGDIFCDLLLSNANAILTSATLVRRDMIEAVGAFDENPALRCAEDWDFYLRLAAKYPFASIDEILLLYRHHETGLTANNPYWAAVGRLITVQKARHYAGREKCLDDAAYDRLEAERNHVMGVVCWGIGQRAEARQYFHEAIRLDPSGRWARRLHILFSYAFPPAVLTAILRLGTRLKRLFGA